MTPSRLIEIRLHNGHTTGLPSTDLLRLIETLEAVLTPPSHTESGALALITAGQDGHTLQFQPRTPQILDMYQQVTTSIQTGAYQALTAHTRHALSALHRFLQTHTYELELGWRDEHYHALATLRPQQDLKIPLGQIQGQTTLYGTVLSLHEAEAMTVCLRLLSGETLTCTVRDRASFVELLQRVNTMVGLAGIAAWDIHDLSLQGFEIHAVTPYRKVPMQEALRSLAEVMGEHVEALERTQGIGSFVAEMRGYDEVEG